MSYPTAPSPFDAAALREALRVHVTDLIGEEDPDFIAELSETFCESATDLVAEARGAAAIGDAEALGRVAHQLRGSAVNVGFAALAAEWEAVEHAGAAPGAAIAATEAAVAALGC